MKRIRILSNWRCRRVNRPAQAASADRRRGSTIIVVLALVSMLMVLGFLFLTLASQERIGSQNFSDALKGSPANFDYFEWTNRQIILGADASEGQSALYGSRHSLLATLFGRDTQPFSGEGINLAWDQTASRPVVDRNYDGDGLDGVDFQPWMAINVSPAAVGAVPYATDPGPNLSFVGPNLTNLIQFPAPDVDYTYPDINNTFLSYDVRVPFTDPNTGQPITRQILTPSFWPPYLVRNLTEDSNGDGDVNDPGEDVSPTNGVIDFLQPQDRFTHPSLARVTLRPNPFHMAITDRGNVSTIPRFVSTTADATALGISGPFPFPTPRIGAWAVPEETEDFLGDNNGILSGAEDLNGNGINDFVYEFDADPDNDGVKEAIWLDLGFPMRVSPNGTNYVAMAAVTIKDADGLFNPNAHGNSDPNINLGGNPLGGPGNFISKSNQAITPTEVNPEWGLYANPNPPFQDQHRFYYGHDPASFRELANMEWWWLMTGRPDFNAPGGIGNIDALFPGRYGEVELITPAWNNGLNYEFPGPGETFTRAPGTFNPNFPQDTDADDNNNRHNGGQFVDNDRTFPQFIQFPAHRHPLDFRGSGSYVQTNGKQRTLLNNGLNPAVGRHQWPRYVNYQGHPTLQYRTPDAVYGNMLLPNFASRFLVDEPAEMTDEPKLDDANDNLYPASQNVIHLSNTDLAARSLYGNRIFELAPINFDLNNNDPAGSLQIRRQFATTSWDLKSWGKPFYPGGGPLDKFRRWEFFDMDGDGRPEFPPTFGGTDPFRPELRALLTIEAGDTNRRKVQRRLSVNGVLDREPPQNNQLGRLRFRPLTPHPIGLTNVPIPNFGITQPEQIQVNSPPALVDFQRQEYMARRDRQLMARDIYVLLYTLGGGKDSGANSNYTGDNAANQRYSNDQLRAMAQFAVNLVDALDPDDEITIFEYDTNLGNGWGLDDNPYTTVDGGIEREVVFGVEEQKLTFSEVMPILAKRVDNGAGIGTDQTPTEYNDTQHRDFTYIELQNVSPNTVNLTNDAWQIVLRPFDTTAPGTANGPDGQPGVANVDDDRDGTIDNNSELGWRGSDDLPNAGEERRLTLTQLAGTVGTGTGSLFSIGTAGDNSNVDPVTGNLRPSFFMVDPLATNPPNFVQIAPRGLLNLDLMTAAVNSYRVNQPSTSAVLRPDRLPAGDGQETLGSAVDPAGRDLLDLLNTMFKDSILTSGDVVVRFDLRRRASLTRVSPAPVANPQHAVQSADNPWITVDSQIAPLRVFTLQDSAIAGQVQAELQNVRSRERRQPLSDFSQTNAGVGNPANPLSYRFNSLGQDNDNSPATFELWQPHFDRDFASVVELFNLPLFSPEMLTERLGKITGSYRLEELHTASSRFLNPLRSIAIPDSTNTTTSTEFSNPTTPPSADPVPTPGLSYDNRWYRLLEFLEIPEKGEKFVVDDTGRSNNDYTPWHTTDVGRIHNADGPNPQLRTYRRAGRINPNTIRHPTVLAGLLDDNSRFGITFDTERNPRTLPDADEPGTRDWWSEFLQARDGLDPLTGLPLPGVPHNSLTPNQGSRPFRSLGFAQRGNGSLQDTLLRSLPIDGLANPNPRRLFEVGTLAEHDNFNVDYATKHRLLSKIYNNATTRSNVFLVFIQIDFFEAAPVNWTNPNTGQVEQVVRIGDKLFDSPGMRGFFVIDRSKGMEAIRSQYIPQVWVDANGNRRFTDSFYWNGVNRRVNPPQNVHQPLDFRPMILHKEIIVDNN